MFDEGKQIGPYTLLKLIGRGGFGEVWLAERRTELVTTQFAVKLPLSSTVDLATIKQEANIWARVSGHANVLPIIEANIYDGQIVIVSEYASDGSLANKLFSDRILSVRQAVEMVLGILNGLEFLHSREIIHRDLKPENILLQGATPRLADFGISRAMKATQISSSIMGTPSFMAPEAFDGKRDKQTDVWSVGVILYLLLSGGLPFPQSQVTELIAAIIWREPPPLPPSIPVALRGVVARALAKNPAERYRLAEDMRRDLLLAVNHFSAATKAFSSARAVTGPVQSRPATDPSAIKTQDVLVAPDDWESQREVIQARPSKVKSISRGLLVAAGILGALLLIGGLFTAGIYWVSRLVHNARASALARPPKENFIGTAQLKDVLTKIDSDNGGPLKMLWIVVYQNELYVIVHDSKIAENYDRYTYRDGTIKKEPDRFEAKEYWNMKEFSLAEVDFSVTTNIVKVAKEKSQSIEDANIESLAVTKEISDPHEKVGKIKWSVYVQGARKDLHLAFDVKGNLEPPQ
jgi:serine/threonine protein kinase